MTKKKLKVKTEEIKVEELKVAEKPSIVSAPNAQVDTSRAEVYNNAGNLVRTYSRALHGENMVEYAKSYAKKIGGSWRQPIIL